MRSLCKCVLLLIKIGICSRPIASSVWLNAEVEGLIVASSSVDDRIVLGQGMRSAFHEKTYLNPLSKPVTK